MFDHRLFFFIYNYLNKLNKEKQLDIIEFYPLITKNLLKKSSDFAKE